MAWQAVLYRYPGNVVLAVVSRPPASLAPAIFLIRYLLLRLLLYVVSQIQSRYIFRITTRKLRERTHKQGCRTLYDSPKLFFHLLQLAALIVDEVHKQLYRSVDAKRTALNAEIIARRNAPLLL